MYQQVGTHLSQAALGAVSDIDIDAFGRSAFNRYYYSSYLTARSLLGKFDDSWRKESHSNVPTLLQVAAKGRLLNAARRARRVLPAQEIERSLSQAIDGLKELAVLLVEAYSVRVLADYVPETKAVRIGGGIRLGPTSLGTASHWPERARVLSGMIESSGRALGIF